MLDSRAVTLPHPGLDRSSGEPRRGPVLASGDPIAQPGHTRRRLKRLRFAVILLLAALLGLVSFVFGMFMAVASDLPALEDSQLYNNARNSVLLDDEGRPIAILSKQSQILVTPNEIPAIVKDAVISIEDKRFMTNSGIDLRSIARALEEDLLPKGGPGGIDDRGAVRQERPPGADTPHDLREAAGGRARLPSRPPLVQAEDHHRVPEHDLFRQRRLWHRGGGEDILRQRREPPRLRAA